MDNGDNAARARWRWGAVAGAVVGFVLLVVVVVYVIASAKVPNGYVGMSYGGGVFEGQHFQGEHVGPTGRFINGWADNLYLYPTTQRNYIISQHAGEGDRGQADSIVALDADGVQVSYEVAVYFKLNLDRLQAFHENIGIKYHAWCDGGGITCSEGWDRMLNDSFRQQLENALQTSTRDHHTADFLTADTVRDIQNEIAAGLKDNVNGVLGGDYFCGPTFVADTNACPDFKVVLKKPSLPQAVVDRYSEVQQSLIAIQTKQNEVRQAELEAEAIAKRQHALESCGQVCVLYEAIKAGDIKFWVIPGDTALTIPGPQA